MPRCLIALGGNLGEVRTAFRAAWELLARVPGVSVAPLSRLYRTPAVGDAAGNDFRNAVGALETALDPLSLLDRLQATEASLGRTREIHWGPRTIDLDLVLYGDAVIDQPRLRVPHPACWYRRFVLDPLVEIAPGTVHPVHGVTFAELRRRLLPRPLPVALIGDSTGLGDLLAPLFREVRFVGSDEACDCGLRIRFGSENSAGPAPALTLTAPSADRAGLVVFVRYVLESALADPIAE